MTVKHSTPFSGGSISAYTVGIGTVGDANKYTAAFDVYQGASNVAYQDSTTAGSENFGAPVNIKITATSSGGALSTATAGSVDVWVLMSVRS